jgi:hypothetical protein
MTSLPLVLDDHEPIGIILRTGRQMLRPAKIWAYCWFTDEAESGGGDHTHRHLPEHID